MNRAGLRKKLLLSHMSVALCSLLFIMLLVNLVMTISFGKYVGNQQKAEASFLLDDLITSFKAEGTWTMDSLMMISHQAMQRNYTVTIYDAEGKELWNTEQMGMGKGMGMADSKPISGGENTTSYPIIHNGKNLGTLVLQTNGGEAALQNRKFLQMFNRLSWGALGLVLLGATLYSRFIATGLSRPLVQIREIAVRMREGKLSERIILPGNQTEIEEVGLALNYLADTLEQQEKLRKNLTADVAHELRTPLTTIQSHIEAFQDGIWEATPDKLQVCHNQVLRLVQLVNDLEKLSAAENPMIQLRQERLSLNEVIQESIDSVDGQRLEKGLSLVFHEQKNVEMTGDRERLLQVFVNLLNNAYKYTQRGQIDVGLYEEAAEIRITVTDTGLGITSEELPFIFERFYRGEKSRNRKTGGAGIGLAIVKAIVEAHGGKITVSSLIHEGSTFVITFPK